MKEWFENFDDKLWLRTDDSGEDEAGFIKKALRLRKGQSVLDAPCGAGRIAVHLAKAGCKVTGVDLREKFIRRSRRRFNREKLSGKFCTLDLRKIDFENEFHTVFNWFGSFGYFSDEENLDVLRRFARALRPGGRVLIDQPNRANLMRHFRGKFEQGNITIHNYWDSRRQCIDGAWVVKSGSKKRRYQMLIRLYTLGQFRRLFDKVGLKVEALYGTWLGEPYRRGSKRLVIVGKKGKE